MKQYKQNFKEIEKKKITIAKILIQIPNFINNQ